VSQIESDRTKMVVGLGNPGRQYAGTRHNVGFEVLEVLRRRQGLGEGRKAFRGVMTEWRPAEGGRVLLLQPHTFMNLSGQSAGECATFYKVSPLDVMVVLDDLALPLGVLRARAQGTAGGHKGLTDVLKALGTDAVPRLRVGIGAPRGPAGAVDFVLGTFAPGERRTMEEAIDLAAQAVEDWVRHGIDLVMNRYNQKTKEEPPGAEGSS
jgi:peptidyl-tRNA hydrolase, PTH1 family